MKSFKSYISISLTQFRQWVNDYKVWSIVIILLMLTQMYTSAIKDFHLETGYKISFAIFPFLFTDRIMRLLFFFPLLLLFCNAPFINRNQAYIISRCGRQVWCKSQIIYIIFSSAIYFLFIMIISVIINFPNMEFSIEWGKAINSLSGSVYFKNPSTPLIINGHIVEYFSPMQVMLYSFVLLTISGILIGLILFFINLNSKNKFLGIIMVSSLLLLDAVASDSKLTWLSPISWNNISQIRIGDGDYFPDIIFVVIMYNILIISFVFLITKTVSKRDIEVVV